MQKLIFFILLVCSPYLSVLSQDPYSISSLEQSSQEELETLLQIAQKQKNTGTILLIAGSTSIVIGGLVVAVSPEKEESSLFSISDGQIIGGLMILGGLVVDIIGIPVLATGSSRVKRITETKAKKYPDLGLNISPCLQQSLLTKKTYPGIALKISL